MNEISHTLSSIATGAAARAERWHQDGAPEHGFAAHFRAVIGSGSAEEATSLPSVGEAREAATKLVSSAFIVPVLARLRETGWAAGPFAPGIAEKRFGPVMDQSLADRIVSSGNFDIVDAIVERATGTRPTADIVGKAVERIA